MKQTIIKYTSNFRWNYILIFLLTTPLMGLMLFEVFRLDEILFHTIAEAITIVMAIVIVIILSSMWKHVRLNTFVSIVCISIFFTGIIDVFHIFAYPGLDYFSDKYAPGELITSFWIFSRYFQASTILIALLIHQYAKKVQYPTIVLSFLVVTVLGIGTILLQVFPETYSQTIGLTPFKIISEYIIILLLLISAYLVIRFKVTTEQNMVVLYLVYIGFLVISEYFFTLYILPTDIALFIGHHFKILASFIITYILVRLTIISPSDDLYNQVIQQRNQLSKLLKYETLTREITEICSSAVNNNTFIGEVLTILGSTLEVDHTFIYRYHKDRKTFKLSNSWFNQSSQFSEVGDGYEFIAVDSLVNKLSLGTTHYCADTSILEDDYDRENFLDIGLYSFINEPLFVFGEFYGFMGYNMTTANRETLEDDITLIRSVAKIITQTIERTEAFKEIEYLNNHDDLTGTHNRRFFESYIQEVDQPEYYPLGIVVIDLNGLKLINDAFGHVAGDVMLQKTVTLLEQNLTENGTLCRIGGDEFVVLMTNTEGEEVYNIFKSIETQCEEVFVSSVQLSLSYGVHIRTSNETPFYEEFKIAEDEMYRMKLMDVPSMRTNAIETILTTLFEKDQYSKDHCSNVSILAERVAQNMGFNTNHVNDIKMAGLLHDIGKIIVPDHILKKTEKFTPLDYLEIKKHTEIGYRILSSTKDFRKIADYVLSHHEYYNGNGYPHGIKGDSIPIESRIISVVDAFDAMVSYRSYRNSISISEALIELQDHSGTQFDPVVVSAFVEHIDSIIEDIYPEITNQQSNKNT